MAQSMAIVLLAAHPKLTSGTGRNHVRLEPDGLFLDALWWDS